MFFSWRKDFIVYQEINVEPTKVTDNNFKDKVQQIRLKELWVSVEASNWGILSPASQIITAYFLY